MPNYNYKLTVTPNSDRVMKFLIGAITQSLKTEVAWEKNTGKLEFQWDDTVPEEGTEGDPLMVRRIKAAEAELRTAMEAAAAVGLNVQWVSVGADGRRQILPEPTVIITRTY